MITIISTATNATVNGIPVPVGSSQFPFAGSVTLYNGTMSTQFSLTRGDIVALSPSAITQIPTADPVQAWTEGFVFGLVIFGTIGLMRRAGRIITRGSINASDL